MLVGWILCTAGSMDKADDVAVLWIEGIEYERAVALVRVSEN